MLSNIKYTVLVGFIVFAEVLFAGSQYRCEDPFLDIHRSTMEANLRTQIPGRLEFHKKVKDKSGFVLVDRISYFAPNRSEPAAHIEYRYNSDESKLFVDDLRVETEFRDQGLSKLLFFAALNSVPFVRLVGTNIGLTNIQIFSSHYEATGDLIASIRKTPAYKIRIDAGFSQIIEKDPYTIDLEYDKIDGPLQLLFHMR
jgi:hypothetical protein